MENIVNRACDEHRRRHTRCPINCPGRLQLLQKQKQRYAKKENKLVEEIPTPSPIPKVTESISLRRRGRKRKNESEEAPQTEGEKSHSLISSSSSTSSSSVPISFVKRKKKYLQSASSQTDSVKKETANPSASLPSRSCDSVFFLPSPPQSISSSSSCSSLNNTLLEIPSFASSYSAHVFGTQVHNKYHDVDTTVLKGEDDILIELSNSDEIEEEERKHLSSDLELETSTDVSHYLVDEYKNSVSSSDNSTDTKISENDINLSEYQEQIQKFKACISRKEGILQGCFDEKQELLQTQQRLYLSLQQIQRDINLLDDLINTHHREKSSLELNLKLFEQRCKQDVNNIFLKNSTHLLYKTE